MFQPAHPRLIPSLVIPLLLLVPAPAVSTAAWGPPAILRPWVRTARDQAVAGGALSRSPPREP